MISHRTIAVVKREAKAQIATKAFVIATIALPLLMFLLMVFMLTLGSVENSDETHVTIVTSAADVQSPLRDLLAEYNFVQSGQYTIVYHEMTPSEFERFLERERPALLADNHRGVFYLPERAASDKNVRFYSANPQNADVRDKIGRGVNFVLNRNYLKKRQLNLAEFDFVQMDMSVEGIKVSKDGSSVENYGDLLIASVFVCLLMISIFFVASPVPGVVIEEKSGRIAEILISSMTPQELFTGKLIASTINGLFQMAIWMCSFATLIWITTDVMPIPESFRMTLNIPVFAYYLLNHVIGLMIFITIFAGLASAYDNLQDVNTVIIPSVFLVLIPFYASFTLLGNPANSVAETLSMFPFTSLYVMPARIALIDVPATEILIATAINVGTLYLLLVTMGRIYKIGIMTTGRKPTMREVMTWLRNP